MLVLFDFSISMFNKYNYTKPLLLRLADDFISLEEKWQEETITIIDPTNRYIFMHFPPYPPKTIIDSIGAKYINWRAISEKIRSVSYFGSRGLPRTNPLIAIVEGLESLDDTGVLRLVKNLWIVVISDFKITMRAGKHKKYLERLKKLLKNKEIKIILLQLDSPNEEGKEIINNLSSEFGAKVIYIEPDRIADFLKNNVLEFAKHYI